MRLHSGGELRRPLKPTIGGQKIVRRHSIVLCGLLMVGAVAACAPTRDVRGYVPSATLIAQITPGTDTKESILQILGSPSSTATFDTDSWYYIGRTTERVAFFDEVVLEQTVVAVDFTPLGIVSGVRAYTLDDAQDVVPVEGKTPTLGRELGLLQQLLGNIGRFNPPAQ